MRQEWSHRDSAPVFLILSRKSPAAGQKLSDMLVLTDLYFLIALLHNNRQDAKISPITIEEASGAAAVLNKFMRTGGQQVKGKQVEDLCDLVTVSREYKAMRERAATEESGTV